MEAIDKRSICCRSTLCIHIFDVQSVPPWKTCLSELSRDILSQSFQVQQTQSKEEPLHTVYRSLDILDSTSTQVTALFYALYLTFSIFRHLILKYI